MLAAMSMMWWLAAAGAAGAQTLPRYAETVWLNADGTARVEAEIDLPAGTREPVQIPLAAAALTGLTISGVDGARAAIVSAGGRQFVSIVLPDPLAGPATLRVRGDLPQFFAAMQTAPQAFGNRTLTRRVLNTTPAVIGTLTSEIVLPAGYVVTSIEDSDPYAGESSTAQPYAVVSSSGRHAVRITASNVGLGGVASVTFRFKQRIAARTLPAALLVLSAAYLIGFRSLVRRDRLHR